MCDVNITLRNVDRELARALDTERRRRKQPLNRVLVELLREVLGLAKKRRVRRGKTNGLERFAGTWTEEQFQEFERAVAHFERLDERP